MSKLRKSLILIFAILSLLLTTFGFLSKLEHWPHSFFYVSYLLGLLFALVVIVLVLVKPKVK